MKEQLREGDIHIWYAAFNPGSYSEELLLASGVLSPAELKYMSGCQMKRRSEYLVSRFTLRSLLSRYFPFVKPGDWQFKENSYGKPEVAGPIQLGSIKFNVSHSEGLAAFAFSNADFLGVDIESVKRGGSLLEIAESNFSQSEVAEIKRYSGQAFVARFFHYWTLKEAFIKAVGQGLSIDLKQFSFQIDNPQTIEIQLGDQLKSLGSGWQFHMSRPRPAFQLAVAAKYATAQSLRVVDKGFFRAGEPIEKSA